jgi:oligopeptide/dipeptide ABC transporter ATP-binding protein
MSAAAELLSVRDLSVRVRSRHGEIRLTHDVSFDVRPGQIVGLVGESGSGKSVTASALLDLLPSRSTRVSGHVLWRGEDLLAAPPARLRSVRGGEIGLITQDALTALDPVFTIGQQLAEAVGSHRRLSRAEVRTLSIRLLEEVGISDPERRLRQYPFELSGGMRQRVLLAIALCNSPSLLIADEPTTALDVTIQAQLVKLLAREATERGMAMILITHDLRLVAGLCDEIVVMYGGRVVERGTARAVYEEPRHPYTKALLACATALNSPPGTPLEPIRGTAPDPADRPPGCVFAPRCPLAFDRCLAERPALRVLADGRSSACHLSE